MSNVLLSKDLEIEKVSFGVVKTLEDGAAVVSIAYDNVNNALFVQTPELLCKDGCVLKGRQAIFDASFKLNDKRENVVSYFSKMKEIDAKTVDFVVENSEKLFGRPLTHERVVGMYTPTLRTDSSQSHVSIMISMHGDVPSCPIQDTNGNEVSLNDVNVKGIRVTAILKCVGLWAAAGKMGLCWKTQALRCNPPTRCAFRDDGEQRICDAVNAEDDDGADDVLVVSGDEDEEEADVNPGSAAATDETKTVVVNTK